MINRQYSAEFDKYIQNIIGNKGYTVFALTHLPEAWDKLNWIRTSENYERICLKK
jgi:hypothetical protein